MVKIDVLTYCSGYSFEVYDRFVGTLIDTGYSGTIYIVVQKNDVQVMARLLKKYERNVRVILDNINITTNMNNHRYLVYKKFLETTTLNCDYVFICDSRDVLFQKNIEKKMFDLGTDIYCFAEDIQIKNEHLCNIGWLLEVERITGEKFFDSIKENMVLCSGTTLMTPKALNDYISRMYNIISTYDGKMILDQGIHNYLMYNNKLNSYKIKILDNNDNFVNTVGFGFKNVKDGKIVNKLDEESYIVHQYDRFSKELLLQLDKKYNFFTN